MFSRFVRRRVEVKNRRASRSESRSLIMRRQEAVGPVGWASLRQSQLCHYDITGQVLIFRTQTVGRPCSQARVSTKSAARVHVQQCFRVIQRLRLATTINAQFISHFRIRQKLPRLRHFNTGVADLSSFERTANVEASAGLKTSRSCRLGHMQRVEFRLWIERVRLRWTSFHKEHDYGFRLRIMHRLLRCQRTSKLLLSSLQVCDRQRSE